MLAKHTFKTSKYIWGGLKFQNLLREWNRLNLHFDVQSKIMLPLAQPIFRLIRQKYLFSLNKAAHPNELSVEVTLHRILTFLQVWKHGWIIFETNLCSICHPQNGIFLISLNREADFKVYRIFHPPQFSAHTNKKKIWVLLLFLPTNTLNF